MKSLIDKFNTLDIKAKLDRLDDKKIILAVLVSLVFIYLSYAALKMQFNGLRQRGLQIAKISSDLEKLNKDLETMRRLKASGTEPDQAVLSKPKRLITQDELLSLLQEISDLANANKAQILQMKHTKDAKDVKKEGASNFTALAVNMELLCDYHNFGKLLDDLDNTNVFLSVESIKIAYSEKDYLRQKINLGLKTYMKN